MTTASLVVGDALPRIARAAASDHWASVFTSLPDAAETGQSVPEWRSWFLETAAWTVAAADPNGYAIFYQTDRRHDGGLTSKAHLITAAAEAAGARVMWHKIAVRTMGTSLFRPTYTHLICVSKKGRPGKPTPDVFMAGKKVYPNATDATALDVALGFLDTQGVRFVADPFCGRGSISRAASQRGMDSLSVDIDADAVRYAARLIEPHADVVAVTE